MPRRAKGLTAAEVEKKTEPGRYGDGAGLYLYVRGRHAKFWVYRYTDAAGRLRDMGLGTATGNGAVSLKDARDRVADLARTRRDGLDPITERQKQKVEAKATAVRERTGLATFRSAAEDYLRAHEAEWKNAKHRQQWASTLSQYAYPFMGDLPVAAIATAHVLAALKPIWADKTETATRLRQRIEKVMDFAKVAHGLTGDNPARWQANLDQLLAKPAKIKRADHHAALPYADIGSFMAELREREATAARALEFVILTAARTGEVIGARWREIDVAAKVWTIPAERMKARKEHRVPLSTRALAILHDVAKLRPDDDDRGDAYIFPGERAGKPVSNMAMAMLLRRMGRDGITVHGFRSTFRDWAAEQTNFAREVAEQALAHRLKDKVEAAYQRGDLFEKRRKLMDAWGRYCATPQKAEAGATVTPIRAAK